jgi:hypothetical protein
MKKRALIIGSQTGNLSGANTDAAYMASILGKVGFELDICARQDATRTGILSKLLVLQFRMSRAWYEKKNNFNRQIQVSKAAILR